MRRIRTTIAALAILIATPLALAPAAGAAPVQPDATTNASGIYVYWCITHPYGPRGAPVGRWAYGPTDAGRIIYAGGTCRYDHTEYWI